MSMQAKVSILGLSIQALERTPPCLAVYNLKLYSMADEELKKKVSITVHDEHIDTIDGDILERLTEAKPDILALSCYLWSTDKLIRIAKKLRTSLPKLKVILGGPDVGPRAQHLIETHPFISGIAHGEGEEIFRQLLRRITGIDNGEWKHTPGLICKNGVGFISNPAPAPIDADRIPLVMNDDDFRNKYGNWLYIESSRGCKFRCAYCAFWSQMCGWRTRSLSTIFKAIDETASNGGTFVSFLDAGFNQDKERFRAVMEYTRKYPDLSFDGMEINIEEMDREDIELLAEKLSGKIGIGLQTTNPKALRIINRRYRAERYRERIQMLHTNNVEFDLDLICGLPGDNYEGFKQSIDDAYSLNPNLVLTFPLLILPGTKFEERSKELGLNYSPEPPYTIESCNTFSKTEIKKAKRLANANYVLTTFSHYSAGLQLASKELGVRPTDLLESFVQGKWRNKKVSDDDLARWKDRSNVAELILAVRSFIEHEFQAAGYKHIPIALRDVFELQFNLGMINCSPPQTTDKNNDSWPPSEDSTPSFSQSARVLDLQTDALSLLHDRPSLSEVEADPHHLLIQRTKKTVRRMRIPVAIAHILKQADGTRSIDEILGPLLEKIPKSNQQYVKTRMLNTLADLTRRQIIVWK